MAIPYRPIYIDYMNNNTATALAARDEAFRLYEAARWGNLRSRLGQLHNDYIKACEAYNAARRSEMN